MPEIAAGVRAPMPPGPASAAGVLAAARAAGVCAAATPKRSPAGVTAAERPPKAAGVSGIARVVIGAALRDAIAGVGGIIEMSTEGAAHVGSARLAGVCGTTLATSGAVASVGGLVHSAPRCGFDGLGAGAGSSCGGFFLVGPPRLWDITFAQLGGPKPG